MDQTPLPEPDQTLKKSLKPSAMSMDTTTTNRTIQIGDYQVDLDTQTASREQVQETSIWKPSLLQSFFILVGLATVAAFLIVLGASGL